MSILYLGLEVYIYLMNGEKSVLGLMLVCVDCVGCSSSDAAYGRFANPNNRDVGSLESKLVIAWFLKGSPAFVVKFRSR
jgi:hypothetical protein